MVDNTVDSLEIFIEVIKRYQLRLLTLEIELKNYEK